MYTNFILFYFFFNILNYFIVDLIGFVGISSFFCSSVYVVQEFILYVGFFGHSLVGLGNIYLDYIHSEDLIHLLFISCFLILLFFLC